MILETSITFKDEEGSSFKFNFGTAMIKNDRQVVPLKADQEKILAFKQQLCVILESLLSKAENRG